MAVHSNATDVYAATIADVWERVVPLFKEAGVADATLNQLMEVRMAAVCLAARSPSAVTCAVCRRTQDWMSRTATATGCHVGPRVVSMRKRRRAGLAPAGTAPTRSRASRTPTPALSASRPVASRRTRSGAQAAGPVRAEAQARTSPSHTAARRVVAATVGSVGGRPAAAGAARAAQSESDVGGRPSRVMMPPPSGPWGQVRTPTVVRFVALWLQARGG